MDDRFRGAFAPALPGTPGGPVQESPTMARERNMQRLAGLAAMLGPTAAGVYAGAPAGPMGAAFGGVVGSELGGLVGEPPYNNANEPNIRDVWTDKLRMKLQELGRR